MQRVERALLPHRDPVRHDHRAGQGRGIRAADPHGVAAEDQRRGRALREERDGAGGEGQRRAGQGATA
jgi:hypothetical protein